MEEQNIINDGVNTVEEIEARKQYIDKVWATFPDLCNAITECETNPENGWTPTRDIVAEDMITKDNYVRKAIDFKLA